MLSDLHLTGSDEKGILAIKLYLYQHFIMRDLEKSLYFLGIEFSYEANKLNLFSIDICALI